MRVSDYTEALYRLSREGVPHDTLLTNLHTTLAARGHERLLPKILRALTTRLTKDTLRSHIRVTVAKESDAATHHAAIREAVAALGGTEHTVCIDPTITGGFMAEHREGRIDETYKTKLLTLYRSLIS